MWVMYVIHDIKHLYFQLKIAIIQSKWKLRPNDHKWISIFNLERERHAAARNFFKRNTLYFIIGKIFKR